MEWAPVNKVGREGARAVKTSYSSIYGVALESSATAPSSSTSGLSPLSHISELSRRTIALSRVYAFQGSLCVVLRGRIWTAHFTILEGPIAG